MIKLPEGVDIRGKFYDGGDYSASITNAVPGGNTSVEEFGNEEIEEIYHYNDSFANDYTVLWIYGKLKDGRYFILDEWADYTFSGMQVSVANSREEIERYGLSAEQRRELGIVLPDIA